MTKDTCNKFIEGINPAIDNDTSRRITALRFLLIVLVVFIHNCYTLQSIQNITDSGGTAPIFVENAFGTWIKLFITSGIARSAVPIFFMFSAYLQERRMIHIWFFIKKRCKSLLLPYILWMFIYGFYYAGLKLIIVKIAPQFLNNPESTCL